MIPKGDRLQSFVALQAERIHAPPSGQANFKAGHQAQGKTCLPIAFTAAS